MNRREFILGGVSSMLTFPSLAKVDVSFNDELNDLIEFSKTCNIVNLKDGVTKFNPRPYQIEYFKNILESNTLVCRKCRQCGATTMNLIYAHWMAERHPEKKVVLVYNKMMMAQEAKNIFNSMFYDNPSKWNENLPTVEFVTYDYFRESLHKHVNPICHYSSRYMDLNTTVLFDEYAFIPKNMFSTLMVCNMLDSMKTVWVSTSCSSKDIQWDIMWGNGKSSRTMTRMKITGEQVFPQYRLSELRNCLGEERFNQEIQV